MYVLNQTYLPTEGVLKWIVTDLISNFVVQYVSYPPSQFYNVLCQILPGQTWIEKGISYMDRSLWFSMSDFDNALHQQQFCWSKYFHQIHKLDGIPQSLWQRWRKLQYKNNRFHSTVSIVRGMNTLKVYRGYKSVWMLLSWGPVVTLCGKTYESIIT